MFYHSGQALLHRAPGGGGGGEEYSIKLYIGRLCPEVQPLYPYTIFHRKGTHFSNAVNALSFNMNKLQNQNDCLTFSQQ